MDNYMIEMVDICKNFGNLKHNTIVSIQEMADGKPVGEPIVPQEDTSIIPTKK